MSIQLKIILLAYNRGDVPVKFTEEVNRPLKN